MKKIVTIFCLFATLIAQGQEYTIDQCREMALQNNKERQKAMLTTEAANQTMQSTKALFFPEFSLMGLGLYDTSTGSLSYDLSAIKSGLTQVVTNAAMGGIITPSQAQYMGQVGAQLPDEANMLDYKIGWTGSANLLLKQPLYMGGRIRAGYQMSKNAVMLARQNERKTEAEVILQTDEAYAQVVRANELYRVAQRYEELLVELERQVASAVSHGMALENDKMKVQVKLNDVRLQLHRAQNGQRLATMNLCHAVGLPLSTPLTVSSDYPEVDDAMQIHAMDITSRPEFAMLEAQADIAEQQVRMARSEMLPQLALLAKYGYGYGVKLNNRTLLHDWNFAGGVTLTVPIYHFGERTHKLKAAQVKQQIAELEKEDKSEMMLLELTRAANNLDEARLESQLTDQSLLQAEKSMQVSHKQYLAGEETLTNYLETQALWQQIYQQRVEAHFQLYLNSVAYLKAAGQLVPPAAAR